MCVCVWVTRSLHLPEEQTQNKTIIPDTVAKRDNALSFEV